MKKIKEREHKFRLIFLMSPGNDIEEYFNMEKQLDDDSDNEIFSVDDINEQDKDRLLAFTKEFLSKQEEIDKKIVSQLKNWNLSRVGACERAILRLACYEMFFDEKIDVALAINEAVELAKKYCEVKSSSFVNGVLSDIAKA